MTLNGHVSLDKREVDLKRFRVSCQSRREIGGGDSRQMVSSIVHPFLQMGQQSKQM